VAYYSKDTKVLFIRVLQRSIELLKDQTCHYICDTIMYQGDNDEIGRYLESKVEAYFTGQRPTKTKHKEFYKSDLFHQVDCELGWWTHSHKNEDEGSTAYLCRAERIKFVEHLISKLQK